MENITEYNCEDCEFYDYDEADDSEVSINGSVLDMAAGETCTLRN